MAKKIQQTGFVRFALHFKGETYQLQTGRKIEGKPEVRQATRSKILYGEWCGGSSHPLLKYKESAQEAVRMEIQLKKMDGSIEVLHSEENPTKIHVEWLAFAGIASDNVKPGKLPTFIRGIKLTSRDHGIKEFLVVEGV